MTDELECKIRVDDHEPLRRLLESAGAERLGAFRETNTLYDDKSDSLRWSGCGLRIRTCAPRSADESAPGPTMTYKGPMREGPFKRRMEIEVTIGSAESAANLLESLGFCARVIFEKDRERWHLGECSVELDLLPRLGPFVEVEGPSEAAIRSAMETLQLSGRESIRRSYVALLFEGAGEQTGELAEFRF